MTLYVIGRFFPALAARDRVLNIYKFGSLESILGLLKRLQIRALGWMIMQTQEPPTDHQVYELGGKNLTISTFAVWSGKRATKIP